MAIPVFCQFDFRRSSEDQPFFCTGYLVVVGPETLNKNAPAIPQILTREEMEGAKKLRQRVVRLVVLFDLPGSGNACCFTDITMTGKKIKHLFRLSRLRG
jgi:hypothetical protein